MLSGCMIVLDEEECIQRSVASIHEYVDEIIVVDGGSTDHTIDILNTFPKVRIIHNPWPKDYSIQRNLAIESAKGEWIFVLDADEYILPYVGQFLQHLLVKDGVDVYI